MHAIRLHGPRDLRFEDITVPIAPRAGEVLVRIRAVGICGSDLHAYQDGRIGTTLVERPIVLGHEFAGVVEAVSDGALDGTHQPLQVGTRVAIDPAQPCGRCELCERGDPNLCLNLNFSGLPPTDGALCEQMIVPASCCFPMPDSISFAAGALLETLGVAIHAIDLAKTRTGDTVAIVGAGPIGMTILQVAMNSGASRVFISDRFEWRLKLAAAFGATTIDISREDFVDTIARHTNGRGVDVGIEAAWADASVQQTIDAARNGGRIVLVGIPGDDQLSMRHSTARRKGLTIRMARRMKHVYPRAIDLVSRGKVKLNEMISHRFPLEKTAEAFAMNDRYEVGVQKIVIEN